MAVTYTTHGTWQSGVPDDGTWDTDSFTPAAGTRLIAVVGLVTVDGVDRSGTISISDSQGLTWTPIGAVGDSDGVDTALAAWISDDATAAVSTTITFTTTASDVFQYVAGVVEVDGSDGTIAGYVEDITPPLNGSGTITLGATPTTDDVVLYLRALGYATDNGWGAIDVASPYTQALVSPGNLSGLTFVASDAATTTTITINDASPGYDPSTRMVDMAFIVRAGGASGAIAATISTTATVSGTATGGSSLAATPSTTATVAGALGHTPSAAASTTATVTSTVTGQTALAATPSTTATVSGAIGGNTALAATPSTTATAAGTLGATGTLAASLSTTATLSGTMDAPDNLAASLSTTTSLTATPGAIVSISAALSTSASLSANNGNDDDYYPSPDVDEAVKSPFPPNYVPDPDEPEYVNDPPDG